MDIHSVLKLLSDKRPIFHSEADFQFALARKIVDEYPDSPVRLEYPVHLAQDKSGRSEPGSTHLDMWVENGSTRTALELKYKKHDLVANVRCENFSMTRDKKHTEFVPEFVSDVRKIEQINKKRPDVNGYVILITNDHLYWEAGRKNSFEGTLHDVIAKNSGKTPREISHSYDLHWKDYSCVKDTKNRIHMFRYLLVEIPPVTS